MSLINRVLGDLAEREQKSPQLMAGVEPTALPGSGRPGRGRLLAALVLGGGALVTFLALWSAGQPRPVPSPRGAPELEGVAPPADTVPVAPQAPEYAEAHEVHEVHEASGATDGTPASPDPDSLALRLQAAHAQHAAGEFQDAEEALVAILVEEVDFHAARESLVALRLDQSRLADARRSLNIGLGRAPDHPPYLDLQRRLVSLASPPPAAPTGKRRAAVAEPPRTRTAAPAVSAEAQAPADDGEVFVFVTGERTARPPPAPPKAQTPAPAPEEAVRTAALPPPATRTPVAPGDVATQAADLARRGQLDAAAGLALPALRANPRDGDLRRLAARIELERGLPQSAADLLLANLPPVALDVESHLLLATAYRRLGRNAESAATYRALLSHRPDQADWWVGYGISLEADARSAAAAEAYARARQLPDLDPRLRIHAERRLAALRGAE